MSYNKVIPFLLLLPQFSDHKKKAGKITSRFYSLIPIQDRFRKQIQRSD